ncbi:MAG: mechanosensitive ion channel family protein [Wenzhouxiangellaceae bacterium]
MLENLNWLPEITLPESLLRLLIATASLVAIVFVARLLIVRFIRRTVQAPELRRRWLVNSRNILLLLLLFGLVLIWGQELRTLALSLVAITLAIVIATKELILCLSGSVLKSGSAAFNIGDRIQVRGFRGEVIDHSLLATTILELGPGMTTQQRSGRKIVLPNSLFLAEPVINESFTERYGFRTFTVPFVRDADWRAARQAFLDAAARYCEPYIEAARAHMHRLSDQRGLDFPSVDPCVTVETPTAGEIHLVVRVPVRASERTDVEQVLLTEVLASNDFSPRAPEKGNGRSPASADS